MLSHSLPQEKERRDLAPVLLTLTYLEACRDGILFDPGVRTDWASIFCGQFAPVLFRGRRRRATNRISRVRRGLVSELSDLQAMHLCRNKTRISCLCVIALKFLRELISGEKKTRAKKGSGKGKNARLCFLVVHPAQTLAKMAGGRSHIPGGQSRPYTEEADG